MGDTTNELTQIPGKRVWFDQGHQQEKWDWGPIPTIEEFGYRAAKKYAEQAGYVVKAPDRPVTSPDVLVDCDLLIIVAPFHLHLQPAEIKAITRAVQNGKSLLLLSYYTGDSHHQNNLSQLGKEFGVEFKSDRVGDALHHRQHKYEILVEGSSSDEDLLQGVDLLCFKQTCSLQVSGLARVVLRSSPDSFTEEAEVTDTGQILSWTATTNSQSPLVAVAAYGAGRFAAVGTWTVFLSEYLESAELGNRQFYLNLLHWLTASTPPPTVPTAMAARTASDMLLDYERGLKRLRVLLNQRAPTFLTEFLTLEARLLKILEDEQLYGSTETTRAESTRTIESLNKLTQKAGLSETFNDLSAE